MGVPVIDLARTSASQLPARIGAAFHDIGFAVFTNHGIPEELIGAAYDAIRVLFSFPDELLRKYDVGSPRTVGYGPFGCETAKNRKVPDLKQFWHVRNPDGTVPNLWPTEAPQVGGVIGELYRHLDRVRYPVFDALDSYLGFPTGKHNDMVGSSSSLLRLLYYARMRKARELLRRLYPETAAIRQRAVRSAPHEDINLITFLIAATASGLKVKTRAGKWVPVNEQRNSIVANVGDMEQMLTARMPRPERRLVSTTHCVVNPPDDEEDRCSAPLFSHAESGVVLDETTGYTAGKYLQDRLSRIYGGGSL